STAADEIRAGHQPQSCQSDRSRSAADTPRPRRRGDRMMKRRAFVTLLGAAAAWPLTARAQPPGKLPTIGFLGSSTLSEASPWASAFVERLRELGWTEGRNVAMAFRWAGGRPERYSEIATEFVGLKVDVIVTFGTPAALATKQATAGVPIVIAL